MLDQETFDLLLETVERFVRERLVPLERSVAEEDHIPDGIVEEMRSLGLFGLTIPTEYGGLGLTTSEEVRVAFSLCRTSPAFRSLLGTNNGIGSQGLLLAGTEAQKRRHLPDLATGRVIASFALTEPDAGSDAAAVRTKATRTADGWILNGTKRYITNAPHAGLFTVFARTEKGVSAFLVPRSAPGLHVGKPDAKMGQQGAHTADVHLEDCTVDDDALLGAEGEGLRIALRTLDRGRIHIAAVCVGIAERLIDDMLSYAMDRRQFGAPIATFQLVQAMLADSRTEAYAARCMVLDAAARRDRGLTVTQEASACKLFASEMVGRVADRAVQVHGGAGYMREYGVERFYRDVRLFRIYEGTSQIQQIVISRAMMRERTDGTPDRRS